LAAYFSFQTDRDFTILACLSVLYSAWIREMFMFRSYCNIDVWRCCRRMLSGVKRETSWRFLHGGIFHCNVMLFIWHFIVKKRKKRY